MYTLRYMKVHVEVDVRRHVGAMRYCNNLLSLLSMFFSGGLLVSRQRTQVGTGTQPNHHVHVLNLCVNNNNTHILCIITDFIILIIFTSQGSCLNVIGPPSVDTTLLSSLL